MKQEGKHISEATGRLVRDYWDLGVTTLGGILFSYHGSDLDLFGNYDIITGAGLFLVGSLAGCGIGSESEGIDRGTRNVLGGVSGMLLGSGNYPSIGLGALTTVASAYMDRVWRSRSRQNSRQPLESIV